MTTPPSDPTSAPSDPAEDPEGDAVLARVAVAVVRGEPVPIGADETMVRRVRTVVEAIEAARR